MNTIDLLDQTFAWTAARIAAVPDDGLDAATPCSAWDLRELLDHMIDSLTMLADGLAAAHQSLPEEPALGPTPWDRAIADLAARSRLAWEDPEVMERTVELPVGTMPASAVASATMLEAVVHGWDISQSSGEAASIPDALAQPVLAFARGAIGDADRGDNFAADLDTGATLSDQLIAFLGRTPL